MDKKLEPVERRMKEALTVLCEAMKEPAGGSYHPARFFLNKHGVYNGDLQGDRVLLRVAEIGLYGKVAKK